MPLPLILEVGAIAAGVTGVGSGIHGAVKMKEANDTMEKAKVCHAKNMHRFEKANCEANKSMDKLGRLELEILHSFQEFSDLFEPIKNRPYFEPYSKNGVTLPRYDGEELKEVSVGAGVLLGSLSGAALGTAGGFAAAGATTAAVMALGTASTGTAIASLSGAAATNAALAALGGGALAAGGGGMALGTTVLGVTTLGGGLLVGGVLFSLAGGKLSDKAEEAWAQTKEEEKKINEICVYLKELQTTAETYYNTLSSVNHVYRKYLEQLKFMVVEQRHTNWKAFTRKERLVTENTVLLVGLLYSMCKVELVLQSEKQDGINTINRNAIEHSINKAKIILKNSFSEKTLH